jgi:5-methylcytosine-specific restriction protein A
VSRQVEEWRGATDDTAIPMRVKLRVFERHGGICHLSRRKIAAGEPWDCDHVKALINGGENRETNLAPALKAPHKAKTAADVAEKAKTAKIRAKHLGLWPKSKGFGDRSRKFNGEISPTKRAARAEQGGR